MTVIGAGRVCCRILGHEVRETSPAKLRATPGAQRAAGQAREV
jgi:hypothetical protein